MREAFKATSESILTMRKQRVFLIETKYEFLDGGISVEVLRIIERWRGFICSVVLGMAEAKWLLVSLEEVSRVRAPENFVRKIRVSEKVLLL